MRPHWSFDLPRAHGEYCPHANIRVPRRELIHRFWKLSMIQRVLACLLMLQHAVMPKEEHQSRSSHPGFYNELKAITCQSRWTVFDQSVVVFLIGSQSLPPRYLPTYFHRQAYADMLAKAEKTWRCQSSYEDRDQAAAAARTVAS